MYGATLDAETIGLASGGYLDNIGTGAFSKAKNLQKVVIPNGLSAIYSNAFAGVESDSVTLVFEAGRRICSEAMMISLMECRSPLESMTAAFIFRYRKAGEDFLY